MWGETAKSHGRIGEIIAFQSSRPVWGETNQNTLYQQSGAYFNPLAPCGARLKPKLIDKDRTQFQSSRPVWGETEQRYRILQFYDISILSPRVGRDEEMSELIKELCKFQSSRPVWGETQFPLCHLLRL